MLENLKAVYVVLLAVGISIGITGRDIGGWILAGVRKCREHRLKNKIVNYICKEWISNAETDPRSGHRLKNIDTLQVARAFKRSAVEMRRLLLRLEEEGRVHQSAPQSNTWFPTKQELHDYQTRHQ